MNILLASDMKRGICQPDCTCRECHDWHKEDGQVEDNFEMGLRCCVDQMALWFKSGDKCRKHPHHYAETGMCEGCESEKGGN